MKVIILSQGKTATVDDEDFERISVFKWYFDSSTGYARHTTSRLLGRRSNLYLHRVVSGISDDLSIDHVDGNRLNCCKSNLRVATSSQNAANSLNYGIRFLNKTSRYVGVYWDKSRKKWTARYGRNGFIGRFDDELEAATAYNDWKFRKHGEFAKLNSV